MDSKDVNEGVLYEGVLLELYIGRLPAMQHAIQNLHALITTLLIQQHQRPKGSLPPLTNIHILLLSPKPSQVPDGPQNPAHRPTPAHH